ncbi:UNVERIFIED_CONTAM: hypothetical protein RMT77_011240 [Armadillidium vulgare]|nr:hypothetical protein Avbf_18224 [Armadillidium vulgare]
MKIFLIFVLMGIAAARMAYQFSDGYLEVLGAEPTQAFTCENRPYGYYADTANDCKVFHICLPLEDGEGQVLEVHQFSFFCGNQTVFSQESLTCVHPEDSLPCTEAEAFYESSNAEFGVIPENKLEERK